MTVQEIIQQIRQLPIEDKSAIAEFLDRELDLEGIEEDLRDGRRELEAWKRDGEGTPAGEVYKRLQID